MDKNSIENKLNNISKLVIDFEDGDLLFISDLLDQVEEVKELLSNEPESEKVIIKIENLLTELLNGESKENTQEYLIVGLDIISRILSLGEEEIPKEILNNVDLFLKNKLLEKEESENTIDESNYFDLDESIDLNSENFKIFVVEAQERVTSAQDLILDLETDLDNLDLINDLFRVFHTIKGECGFLNLTKLGELTHNLENLLDKLRYNEIQNSPEIIETVLSSIDIINILLTAIKNDDRALYNNVNIDSEIRLIEHTSSTGTPPIGQVLKDEGILEESQVNEIVKKQREIGYTKKFGEIAVEENLINNEIVNETLKSQKKKPQKKDAIVKVSAAQINYLVDMIGELLIAENQLRDENIVYLRKITKEIQNAAMMLRTVKMRNILINMKRVVRDASRNLNKKTRLVIEGENLEVDRNLVEHLEEPLIHLLRNAVGHGIESTAKRLELEKPEIGEILLKAERLGNQIIISVRDDGKGISKDEITEKAISKGIITREKAQFLKENEIFDFIFHPGFSTAETIDKVSGRGVGMDIVKSTVNEHRGHIETRSEVGKYTEFDLVFPLSMAIIDGMIILIDGVHFILPVVNIVETLKINDNSIHKIENREAVINIRKEIIPVIKLRTFFDLNNTPKSEKELAIIVEHGKRKYAFIVDKIESKKEVVIKSLGEKFKNLRGISAATVLGGGKIGFIINIDQIVTVSRDITFNDSFSLQKQE